MRYTIFAIAIALLSSALPSTVYAQDAATPDALRSYATRHSIGIEWDIGGDANHDTVTEVRFRPEGTTAWRDGLPLFRIDFAGQNMMAGSILFLRPGIDYEVELQLDDPDGGSELRAVDVSTLPMPARPTSGRTLHVMPGSGGGDGSEGDPYQGIEAADAVAMPGDTMLVHAGDYGTDRLLFDAAGTAENYVAWVAAGDGPARLPDIRVRGDFIWVEGFEISAPNNAVRHEGAARSVAIVGNTITGCNYCVHLGDGASAWWITDNVIVGDRDPTISDFGGEGIELQHTSDHTIAYNRISRVADGVSYPDRNVDIFNNDIFQTSDDGIEPDDGAANVRVWGNRIHNALNNGITFQPMAGAPWYVLYNQIVGSGGSVLKVRDAVDRVLLAHNTFVGWTRVYQVRAGWIRNMHVRNNLWVTMEGDYIWEDTGSPDIPDNWRTSLDYDGFVWPDSISNPLFKWFNTRHTDLAALQAAYPMLEQNAIRVPMSCFESLDVPGAPPAVVPPQHFSLTDGCNAIDAGEVLPNINDGFVGAGPDLGAHERGAPPRQYGPREMGLAPPSPPTGVTAR